MNTRTLAICILALVFLIGMPINALQAAEYDVSVSPDTEIQPRSVELKGSTYTVSAVGNVEAGATFTVATTAPTDENYDIYLYNSDEQIVDTASGLTGSDSASFDTQGFEPGTYVAALRSSNGTFQAIEPVVVSGYSINLSYPDQITRDESATLTASVDPIPSAETDLERVDLIVVRGENSQRYEMTNTNTTAYEQTVSFDQAGEYEFYVVVRGTDTVDGEKEVIGLSTRSVVSVEQTETSTSTTTSNSGTGGNDGTAAGTTTTASGGTQTSETGTETEPPTTSADGTSATVTTTRTDSTMSSSATTQSTTDSVITPGSETDTLTSTATETTGPFPVWGVVVAILLASLYAAQRT